MTILQLTAVHNWGGGGQHIENLCYELSLSHPHIRNIIMVARNGQFHERLKTTTFEYSTLPLAFNFDPRAIYQLIKICRKEEIDLIHIHGPTSLALAVIADHFADLPPFVFSKKISFDIKKRKRTLYKYNYPKIRKYLCVSEQTKQIMIEAIEDKDKAITIYHGTRLDNKSKTTPFMLREKFNIPSHQRIVGNIANHHFSKNIETFIDVADEIVNKQKRKDFIFIQIGTFTKLTDSLLQRIRDKKLDDHVKFLGYLRNASNFIPQFNISLITSTNEGLPQVIYESFFHKIPVVSTNVAGIPEVIEHGKNGFLADAKDVKMLSKYLITLRENNKLEEQFIKTNYPLVLTKFSTQQMAQQTLQEYKKILYGRS